MLENHDSEEINDPLIGRVLGGNYRVDARIGSGGMGTVYLALDQSMDRLVALKVINNLFLGDKKRLQRLITEASALAALSHPNIVKVLASHYSENEPVFVVLEYVQGETLDNIVSKNGPLSAEQFQRYFNQVADALVHAHTHGVVHRDIKPSNLMVASNGDIKILDFGLAKLLGVADQRLTQTGEILGSPHYMSPEQCGTQEVDGRSDIYSLGCTMYYSLTAMPPHDGDSMLNVMFKHMNDTVDLTAITDARVAAIVERCLAKDIEDRFQSSEELQSALASDSLSQWSQRRKSFARKKSFGKVPLAVVAGFVMAAVGVSGYFLAPTVFRSAPEDSRLKTIQEHITTGNVTAADASAVEKLCETPNLNAESAAVAIYKRLGNREQQLVHLEHLAAIHRRDNGFKFVHAYTHAMDLYTLDQQKGLDAMREHLRTYESNKQDQSARRMKYLLHWMLAKTPGNEKELAEIERQLTLGDYEQADMDMMRTAEDEGIDTILHTGQATAQHFVVTPHAETLPGVSAQAFHLMALNRIRNQDFPNATEYCRSGLNSARKARSFLKQLSKKQQALCSEMGDRIRSTQRSIAMLNLTAVGRRPLNPPHD